MGRRAQPDGSDLVQFRERGCLTRDRSGRIETVGSESVHYRVSRAVFRLRRDEIWLEIIGMEAAI